MKPLHYSSTVKTPRNFANASGFFKFQFSSATTQEKGECSDVIEQPNANVTIPSGFFLFHGWLPFMNQDWP